ncbi:hypothetical protein AB0H18_00610 [Streptomyces sp. NPDC020766]|uniref:hypothetical protein n=1 Tax=Streptomyces sp. NPDC020766 TaxID=3155011 RepID=UPI003400A1AD
MSKTRRVCRYCDEPVADLDGAVFLWHEPGLLGPGRDVYTHREHADLLVSRLPPVLAPQAQGGGRDHP